MELEAGNITLIITIVTAIGALYKYISYNEGQDKLQLDVIVNFIDNEIGEIVARIENKGKVRAKILMKDLTWKITPHKSAKTIKSGGLSEDKLIDPIQPKQFLLSNNDNDFTWINGLTTQVYRDYFRYSNETIYVEATVIIKYQDQEREWQSTRKIVKVK